MRRVGLDPNGRPDLALIAPAVAALDLVSDLFGVRLDRRPSRACCSPARVEPGMAWPEG